MIPAHIIEEIRSKSDIVKVVSEYVKLRKRGKNYLGLCPFHSEKDPSFTVSPEKQLFHCFGCNEGGNAIAFIMKIENVGFAEAVAELGNKLGIAVPQATGSPQNRGLRDRLYKITELAANYFQDNLAGPGGAAGRAYLEKRGISQKTASQFRLGFAPSGWDNLFKHLISRGADPKLIEQAGLALAREGQNGHYDRFRNRLMFSVMDPRGRAIAFGGRALGDTEPKYLNSPDTAIYHKGETLFGLHLSKDKIKQSRLAVLVEGNFDLITPFQAGIGNIVASMGTALTNSQCKLIARYCDTIVLAFDADAAGGLAAERSIELLRQQGLKVKIAKLEGGKDPDEVVSRRGKDGFLQCVETALPYLEFRIRRVLARHNLGEIESRSKALREAAQVLFAESDDFVIKEYAKLIAGPLKTDMETVVAEIRRARSYPRGTRSSLARTTKKPNSKINEAEKHLIALAAQDASALNYLKERLNPEDFNQPETRAIAEMLFASDLQDRKDPVHFLLDNLPDERSRQYLSRVLVEAPAQEAEKMEGVLNDCIGVIKNERVRSRINELKLEIKAAENAGETKKAAELLNLLKTEIA